MQLSSDLSLATNMSVPGGRPRWRRARRLVPARGNPNKESLMLDSSFRWNDASFKRSLFQMIPKD